MEEQRAAFSKLLGLDYLVPQEIFELALNDEAYARNLILASEETDKKYLVFWLQNPPKITPSTINSLDLMSQASKALIKWAQTGFTRVDKGTLEKRENACLACPHLTEPQHILQKWNTSQAQGQIGKRVSDKVCGLCNCNLDKKLPIITSFCPSPHPENQQMSRWEE